LRAVCGLPLGAPTQFAPAAMANLLGDLWNSREPNWVAAISSANVKLHLYGKLAARPGRKMGHLTAISSTVEEALEDVVRARDRLSSVH
jgi:5-(carboxyamino)imidazole ribonucleotide synthase